MSTRVVAPILAVLFALAANSASAQTSPSPSPSPSASPPSVMPCIPPVPPTGQIINDVIQAVGNQVTSSYGWNPNRVHGTVTYFKRFDMQVEMQLSKYRDIHLHQGTVINPRGSTIRQGQVVDVAGHANADGSLEADVITLH